MQIAAKILFVCCCLSAAAWAADARPRVAMEVRTRSGLPLTASQQWYKTLSELGVASLQIRAAGAGDEVGISEQGTKAAPSYKVVGILTSDNVLHLPGGKFSLSETGKLRKWFANLGDLGTEGVTQQRSAFGLLPRQLVEVNDDLKQPVEFATADMPAGNALSKVASRLKFPLDLDPAATAELADVTVAEELQGISAGTALAAILRPAGLALVPERPPAGQLHYRVAKAQAGREVWPIGWPPKDKPNKVLSELYESLNVEIKDTPVSEAVQAIQGRLKVPFLFDHNAMALHGVDPTAVMAEVPGRKLTYSQILGKVLLQAKLKFDLRVDENDRPFLWITTVKPTS